MKKNVKINTLKFLASTIMISNSSGSIDLLKDISKTTVSSITSILEPMVVYAAISNVTVGNFVIEFDSSTGNIVRYISGSGHFEIPEKINGVTVKSISGTATKSSEGAFYGCETVTSVSIPNSITFINDYAFSNCTSLNISLYTK